MIHIFLNNYSNEELTHYLGSYKLEFGYIPKVGDLITNNNIEKPVNCCIKEIKFIPKCKNSTDDYIVLHCVVIHKNLVIHDQVIKLK